jgi:hypothetical protein
VKTLCRLSANGQGCAIFLLLLLALGCAHGLKEPRPISPPGAPPAASPEAVAALLAEAEASYRLRPDVDAVRRADALFVQAAASDEKDVAGLIGSIRAKAWLIEHERDARARSSLAASAVDAGQWCERRAPKKASCDYFLALALGLQARESRSLNALKGMTERLRRAAEADPRLDFAGPERVLALVLLNAPAWPIGPGDAEAGLREARRAVELFPDHPPNQLVLSEALEANGSRVDARAAAARALELARARAAAGDPDAPGWVKSAQKLSGKLGGEQS